MVGSAGPLAASLSWWPTALRRWRHAPRPADAADSDKADGTVVWTPVEGQGNALVGGSRKMTDKQTGTAFEFRVDGSVEVPLPAMTKMVVAPVVKGEFEKLVEKYIDNLVQRFGGEV